jgi:hypothetical protein
MGAVDDAGAGYAGLTHILALRPSFVKLDRSLVEGIDGDEAKTVLASALGEFAGQLDAWVLAEGVERPGELDALIRLRVPLAQGYLLARPVEPWAGIDGGLGERIRRRVAATDPNVTGVAGLVEELAADQAEVILTPEGRPTGLRAPDGEVLAIQTVRPSSSARDVLHRALTRDARTRFTPLVVVDSTGHYLGVVRLERLIRFVCP